MKCNLATVALIMQGIGRESKKRREGGKSSNWHLYQEWRKTSEPSPFSFFLFHSPLFHIFLFSTGILVLCTDSELYLIAQNVASFILTLYCPTSPFNVTEFKTFYEAKYMFSPRYD